MGPHPGSCKPLVTRGLLVGCSLHCFVVLPDPLPALHHVVHQVQQICVPQWVSIIQSEMGNPDGQWQHGHTDPGSNPGWRDARLPHGFSMGDPSCLFHVAYEMQQVSVPQWVSNIESEMIIQMSSGIIGIQTPGWNPVRHTEGQLNCFPPWAVTPSLSHMVHCSRYASRNGSASSNLTWEYRWSVASPAYRPQVRTVAGY
jgi:hypothetical protein